MRVIWSILAALSFVGGQILLFQFMQKMDSDPNQPPGKKKNLTYNDACRYPDDIVVE